MTYKVVDSCWFNEIGIVKVENATGDFNLYIGKGDGKDQRADEQKIAATGVKVHRDILVKFMYDRSYKLIQKK
jgi:hypothetical protein